MIAASINDEADRAGNLIAVARHAIATELGAAAPPFHDDPRLHERGACFVTLTLNGELRGCIGSLEARGPLLRDIEHNARAAAFGDPRFSPLSSEEYPHIAVEISLLSPTEPLQFGSEAEALAGLRPGIDGVVFEYRHLRGTFLPQVWEQLPRPQQFIARLKQKCGLPANFWSDEVKLSRYTVDKFVERKRSVRAASPTAAKR